MSGKKRFKGLTPKEHVSLAAKLKDVHFRILNLFFFLQEAYPKPSRPMKEMRRLAGSSFGPFVHLRNHLDNAFFRGCHDPNVNQSPYYGWTRDRQEEPNLLPSPIRERKPCWLSPSQHKHVAAELHVIERELWACAELIWRGYGVSSPQGRAIERFVSCRQPINLVRLAMEDAACREHQTREPMAWYWRQETAQGV